MSRHDVASFAERAQCVLITGGWTELKPLSIPHIIKTRNYLVLCELLLLVRDVCFTNKTEYIIMLCELKEQGQKGQILAEIGPWCATL